MTRSVSFLPPQSHRPHRHTLRSRAMLLPPARSLSAGKMPTAGTGPRRQWSGMPEMSGRSGKGRPARRSGRPRSELGLTRAVPERGRPVPSRRIHKTAPRRHGRRAGPALINRPQVNSSDHRPNYACPSELLQCLSCERRRSGASRHRFLVPADLWRHEGGRSRPAAARRQTGAPLW